MAVLIIIAISLFVISWFILSVRFEALILVETRIITITGRTQLTPNITNNFVRNFRLLYTVNSRFFIAAPSSISDYILLSMSGLTAGFPFIGSLILNKFPAVRIKHKFSNYIIMVTHTEIRRLAYIHRIIIFRGFKLHILS